MHLGGRAEESVLDVGILRSRRPLLHLFALQRPAGICLKENEDHTQRRRHMCSSGGVKQ